jgi:mycofactocin precursor
VPGTASSASLTPEGDDMTEARTQQQPMDAQGRISEARATEEEVLTTEMLVEEVSIDGMCGVY